MGQLKPPQAQEADEQQAWDTPAWLLEDLASRALVAFQCQPDDDLLWLSPGLAPRLGMAASELPRTLTAFLQLLPDTDREDAAAAIVSAREGEQPFAHLAAPDGSQHLVSQVAARARVRDGRPLIVGLWRVTAEGEPEPSLDALRLIGRASHEIRNPLGSIISLVRFAEQLTADEAQRRYLELALGSARSLLQVLDHTIEASRVAGGKAKAAQTWFDLDAVLCEAARAATPAMGWRDFSFVYDFDGDTTEVLADPVALRQIVSNLVNNAARHTVRGHVGLSATLRPADDGRTHCRLVVEDTGVGIAPERIDSLFRPFEQAVEARRHGGYGLGLSIVHGLVQSLGGQIQVSSTLGQGTRFEVTFDWPGRVRHHAPPAPGSAWLVYRPPFVEGAHWLTRRLARLGWKATMLPSVESALAASAGDLPDLVLVAAHSIDDASAVRQLHGALARTGMALVSRLDWAHPEIEGLALECGWMVVPVPVSVGDLLTLTGPAA